MTMDAKEQLKRLVRIQTLALETRAARAVVDGGPGRIEEIEARFRERNAEYVTIRERFDVLESTTRARNLELQALEDSRKKFMDDLMRVTNQREYAALLKEIDSVKARIAEFEDEVLRNMQEIETLRAELDSRSAHIAEERERVGQEVGDVENAIREAQAAILRTAEERRAIEAELPRDLVQTVGRVEDSRQGVFLAEAADGVCRSCFVRVRPQVFQEIRTAIKLHACSNCRRLLYFPAAVQVDVVPPAEGAQPAETAGAS